MIKLLLIHRNIKINEDLKCFVDSLNSMGVKIKKISSTMFNPKTVKTVHPDAILLDASTVNVSSYTRQITQQHIDERVPIILLVDTEEDKHRYTHITGVDSIVSKSPTEIKDVLLLDLELPILEKEMNVIAAKLEKLQKSIEDCSYDFKKDSSRFKE